MSKYTAEVRFICEEAIGREESRGLKGVPQILQFSAPLIFDFDFPIFDENYRLPLEIKILRHYYTREISEETVGLWKLRLEDRMNQIMPYYNQLYKSELLEFNPLYDVDITTTHHLNRDGFEHRNSEHNERTEGEQSVDSSVEHNIDETSTVTPNTTITDTGTKNDDSWNLYSDTPQGGITGIGGVVFDPSDPNPQEFKYLTNATHDHDETGTTNTRTERGNTATDKTGQNTDVTEETSTNVKETSGGTEGWNVISNTDDYLEHVSGKQSSVSFAKLLTEYRETFMNIDKMIIDELSDLFFGLW